MRIRKKSCLTDFFLIFLISDFYEESLSYETLPAAFPVAIPLCPVINFPHKQPPPKRQRKRKEGVPVMNTKLVRFTKYMLDAMFYIGIVLTAAIPVLFYFFGNYIESFRKYYVFQCVIYMAFGVMALFIIKACRYRSLRRRLSSLSCLPLPDSFPSCSARCLRRRCSTSWKTT